MDHLLDSAVFSKSLAAAVAGQGTSNGAAIDMSAFETVTFILQLGALTSTGVVTLKAQESDASGSGYADIVGASVVNTGDTATLKQLVLEVIKPRKRYARCVVIRATADCVIDTVIAIQSGPKKKITTQSASVDASLQIVAP